MNFFKGNHIIVTNNFIRYKQIAKINGQNVLLFNFKDAKGGATE